MNRENPDNLINPDVASDSSRAVADSAEPGASAGHDGSSAAGAIPPRITVNTKFLLQWKHQFAPLPDIQDRSLRHCGELAVGVKKLVASKLSRPISSLDVLFGIQRSSNNESMCYAYQIVVPDWDSLPCEQRDEISRSCFEFIDMISLQHSDQPPKQSPLSSALGSGDSPVENDNKEGNRQVSKAAQDFIRTTGRLTIGAGVQLAVGHQAIDVPEETVGPTYSRTEVVKSFMGQVSYADYNSRQALITSVRRNDGNFVVMFDIATYLAELLHFEEDRSVITGRYIQTTEADGTTRRVLTGHLQAQQALV